MQTSKNTLKKLIKNNWVLVTIIIASILLNLAAFYLPRLEVITISNEVYPIDVVSIFITVFLAYLVTVVLEKNNNSALNIRKAFELFYSDQLKNIVSKFSQIEEKKEIDVQTLNSFFKMLRQRNKNINSMAKKRDVISDVSLSNTLTELIQELYECSTGVKVENNLYTYNLSEITGINTLITKIESYTYEILLDLSIL